MTLRTLCPSQDQHHFDSGRQRTSGSSKSVRKVHTKTMCSASGQSMAGKKWVFWNFFTRSMALSTWMRKVAVWRVLTTSSGSSCWQLTRNGETLHSTPSGRQSWGLSHSQPWLCLLAKAFQVGYFSLSAPCLKYSHHKLLTQTTVDHSVCIQLAASTCFCSYKTNRLHLAPLGWNLDGFAIGNSVELIITSSWILFLEGGRALLHFYRLGSAKC